MTEKAITTMIDPRGRCRPIGIFLVFCTLTACTTPPPEEALPAPATAPASWSVTAWGSDFEIFPEAAPLTTGTTSVAHTHVTRLADFAPLTEGRVEITLSGSGTEQTFASEAPVRPGIFSVEIRPEAPGDFDLRFRISTPDATEEIRGGRIRVGAAGEPGRLLAAPAPKGASDGATPQSFLKEEQWRGGFATQWVRSGHLARTFSGLAKTRPPAGGDRLLTSPVAGVLAEAADDWPFVGRSVTRGAALFRVIPRVAVDRSLATLEAELASLDAELVTARARLGRLEELLALEAASRRDTEEARARLEVLTARRDAAARDLDTARSSRRGDDAAGMTLRAPFTGEIAEVIASPGSTVAAGDPLARVLRTDVLWFEIALAPADAARLRGEAIRGVVLTDPEREPIRIEDGVRLISVAPELSPRTGTLAVLLEAPPSRSSLSEPHWKRAFSCKKNVKASSFPPPPGR